MSTGRRLDLGKVVLLAIAGVLLLWMFRGCGAFPHLGYWGHSDWWLPPWLNVFGLGFLIQLGLAVWVGIDAQRRGTSGLLWGLLVFFTSIVGLLVYAIVCTGPAVPRPVGTPPSATAPGESSSCPSCGRAVRADFQHCPDCGASLASNCPSCGRATETDWKVCAYCGKSLRNGS